MNETWKYKLILSFGNCFDPNLFNSLFKDSLFQKKNSVHDNFTFFFLMKNILKFSFHSISQLDAKHVHYAVPRLFVLIKSICQWSYDRPHWIFLMALMQPASKVINQHSRISITQFTQLWKVEGCSRKQSDTNNYRQIGTFGLLFVWCKPVQLIIQTSFNMNNSGMEQRYSYVHCVNLPITFCSQIDSQRKFPQQLSSIIWMLLPSCFNRYWTTAANFSLENQLTTNATHI